MAAYRICHSVTTPSQRVACGCLRAFRVADRRWVALSYRRFRRGRFSADRSVIFAKDTKTSRHFPSTTITLPRPLRGGHAWGRRAARRWRSACSVNRRCGNKHKLDGYRNSAVIFRRLPHRGARSFPLPWSISCCSAISWRQQRCGQKARHPLPRSRLVLYSCEFRTNGER